MAMIIKKEMMNSDGKENFLHHWLATLMDKLQPELKI